VEGGAPWVSYKWLMDCAGQQQVLPPEQYCV
jgi:hypothetical protein